MNWRQLFLPIFLLCLGNNAFADVLDDFCSDTLHKIKTDQGDALDPSLPEFRGVCEIYHSRYKETWGKRFSRFLDGVEFGKSVAVVVGIGNYNNNAYEPLSGRKEDAYRMRDFLIEDAKFDIVITLTDSAASRAKLELLLTEIIPSLIGSDDRFFFHFSGHGETRNVGQGGRKRGYLVTSAAASETNWTQMIDMAAIRAWSLDVGVARQSVWVIDACFSGLTSVQTMGRVGEMTRARLSQRGQHIFTAGLEDEQSLIVNGRSVFTNAFIDAARHGDTSTETANPDGYITLNEIQVAVGTTVDREIARLNEGIGPTYKLSPRISAIQDDEGQFFFLDTATIEKNRLVELGASASDSSLPDMVQTGGRDRPIFDRDFLRETDAPTQCDKLAGFVGTSRVKSSGRLFSSIEPELAIPACYQAIAQYPDEQYFYLLLARALTKRDNQDILIQRYTKFAADAYPAFTFDRLGLLVWNGYAGFEKNTDLAVTYYEKAVGFGYHQSLISLGDIFRDKVKPDHDRATAYYLKALDIGIFEGAAKLAWQRVHHSSSEIDWDEVLRLYQIAADGDVAWAWRNIGYIHKRGDGGSVDLEKALLAFKKGCLLEDKSACNGLGDIYSQPPYDNDASLILAADAFEKSCQAGNAYGCFGIGWLHAKLKIPEASVQRAIQLYEQGCEGNSGAACHNLALMVEGGQTNETSSDARAVELFTKACDEQDSKACNNLALRYRRGELGLVASSQQALVLFLKACKLGNSGACGYVADIHEDGDLREPNHEKAAEFFLKGCDGGNSWSCARLGDLYEDGDVGLVNYSEAAKWYKIACEGSHAWGCSKLAGLFSQGNGVPQDHENAVSLLIKACDLGNGNSCGELGWGPYAGHHSLARSSGAYLIQSLRLSSDYVVRNIVFLDMPTIRSLQAALRKAGVYRGELDGLVGDQTMSAIEDVSK